MSETSSETSKQRAAAVEEFFRCVEADEPNRFGLRSHRITETSSYSYLTSLSDSDRRAALLAALDERLRLRLAEHYGGAFARIEVLGDLLAHFGRTNLFWSPGQVGALLVTVAAQLFDGYFSIDEYRFAISVTEVYRRRGQTLNEDQLRSIAEIQARVVAHADAPNTGGSADDLTSLRARLLQLAPPKEPDPFGGVAIPEADPFGRAALLALQPYIGDAQLGPTLVHLAKPSGTNSWVRETTRMCSASPLLLAVARSLMGALERTDLSSTWVLAASSTALIKGAAATLATAGDASDAELLERSANASVAVALGSYSSGAPFRACIAALGQLRAPEAQFALARLQASYRSGDVKKRIAAALDEVAARSGLTPGQLIERQVGDAGLDHDHCITVGTPELAAELRVASRGVETTWLVDGRPSAKPSASARSEHADVVTQIKSTSKALATAYAAQRTRLEGLFAEGRSWATSNWQTFYADHRLVGPIVAGLLWQGEIDGNWTTFLGNQAPEGCSRVRLWHPLQAPPEEIEHWRDEIVRQQLRQPFKQVYREHYVLTPAEREAGWLSARFARHLVRIDQLYALVKGRGWQAKWLGAFDAGLETTQRLVLAEGRYRVGFDVELAGDGGLDDCAVTAMVHFDRASGKSWTPINLSDVPPLVLSEAMRDIDLFVSVATVANDPTWRDRRLRADAERAAYDAEANGELTPNGEVRRAALARILPALKIADRCSLDDRSLRVRGNLGDYAIHLGTANVMMLPRRQYLCIVQGSASALRGVFLPFDEDGLLSLILSKAVLLAADDKIRDEQILRQMRFATAAGLDAPTQ